MGITQIIKHDKYKIKHRGSEYQTRFTLETAIEKNYLPSTATSKDVTSELLEEMILGGDFHIYDKDGNIEMSFNTKYNTNKYKEKRLNPIGNYQIA